MSPVSQTDHSAEDCAEWLVPADIAASVYGYADEDERDDWLEDAETAEERANIRSRDEILQGQHGYESEDWLDAFSDELPPGNFERIAEGSGFDAALYESADSNTVYVAFRGSEAELDDWLSNAGRAIDSDYVVQYQLADMVADAAMRKYASQGKNVVFVGHSLGGGLANRAAQRAGTQSYAFNSDGQTQRDYTRGLAAQDAEVNNIYSRENILHSIALELDNYEFENLFNDEWSDWLREKIENGMVQPGSLYELPEYRRCTSDLFDGSGLAESFNSIVDRINARKAELLPPYQPIEGNFFQRAAHRAEYEAEMVRNRIELALYAKELFSDFGAMAAEYHSMANLYNSIQDCANGAEALEEEEQADAAGADSTPTGSTSSGGQLRKPPQIKYNCQFSSCN